MPLFRIHCSTVRAYWLTVEAPSEEAAEKYYEGCGGEEFHAGEEGGWTYDEIERLDSNQTGTSIDVKVDDSGEAVKECT